MITGVQDFYYSVQDMKRAVRFYSETLGLKVLDTNDWWTSLELGGNRIGLHADGPGPNPPLPLVPRDAHGAHAGGTLTLRTNDFIADADRLRRAGAKILGESNQAWGQILVFEDTEGNVLKLMQPTA